MAATLYFSSLSSSAGGISTDKPKGAGEIRPKACKRYKDLSQYCAVAEYHAGKSLKWFDKGQPSQALTHNASVTKQACKAGGQHELVQSAGMSLLM